MRYQAQGLFVTPGDFQAQGFSITQGDLTVTCMRYQAQGFSVTQGDLTVACMRYQVQGFSTWQSPVSAQFYFSQFTSGQIIQICQQGVDQVENKMLSLQSFYILLVLVHIKV